MLRREQTDSSGEKLPVQSLFSQREQNINYIYILKVNRLGGASCVEKEEIEKNQKFSGANYGLEVWERFLISLNVF